MMCPLLTEADIVSQELLDILLINIVEPHKVNTADPKHKLHCDHDYVRFEVEAIYPTQLLLEI